MSRGRPPVFEIRDLQVVRGGSLILDVPSLSVADGEILVIIGPNGAGKSTLLQSLSALVKPARGEIRFRGQRIGTDLPLLQYRRKLAMVLQEPLLFDTTVYHNVASGLKMRGLKRRAIEPKVQEATRRFAIAHLKDRSARTLSGGEARRTSIARAFATDPEVLLLDEPFSALDPIIRETLIEDLEQVLRETRITTVFVTHDRMEALRLATRLGVMGGGRILQSGQVEQVLNRPVNAFVASLVGVETILHAKVVRNNHDSFIASVAGREIRATGDAACGEQILLCIRPENVTLSAAARPGMAGETGGRTNTFPGVVEKITSLGLYRKVQLNCGFAVVAYVTNQASAELSLAENKEVLASFPVADIHVMKP